MKMKYLRNIAISAAIVFSQAGCGIISPKDEVRVQVSTLQTGPAEFQSYKLSSKSGPEIEYYITKTKEKAPLLLFIQGSGCTPVFIPSSPKLYGSTVYNLIPFAALGKYAVMVVKKPYTASKPVPTGTKNYCPREFNEYFTAETWSNAIQVAFRHARELPWVDAKRSLVLGFSEGATIASVLAGSEPGVTNVALIGATGPTQYYDFVVAAYRGASDDDEVQKKLTELDVQRAKIAASPDSADEFAWGHPYKRWSSFFRASSTQHLLKSKAKVYIVSGMQDKNVPILSTETLASELITAGHDVSIRRIPRAGHNLFIEGGSWSDSDPEYHRILKWFDGDK